MMFYLVYFDSDDIKKQIKDKKDGMKKYCFTLIKRNAFLVFIAVFEFVEDFLDKYLPLEILDRLRIFLIYLKKCINATISDYSLYRYSP